MNTDNFIITSSDIELAQDICKIISDESVRNRAVANAIAGSIAAKYFDSESYEIDSESGLHNIGQVLEDIDISDIYINNAYIDVRVFFNENEIGIPVSHIENKLIPAAYMFIKVNPDLSGASVVGFKNPESIDKTSSQDGYYKIREDELESFYDVEPLLSSYAGDPVEIEDSDIYAYLDNTLDNRYSFYAQLLKSKDGRLKLAKAAKAATIFKFVSVNSGKKQTPDAANDTEEQELQFAPEFTDSGEGQNAGDFANFDGEIKFVDYAGEDAAEELDIIDDSENAADSDIQKDVSAENTDDIAELPLQEEAAEAVENADDLLSDDDMDLEKGLAALAESLDAETDAGQEEEPAEIPGAAVEEKPAENFEFSTVASPSNNDILDELSNSTDEISTPEDNGNNPTEKQIDTLFNKEEEEEVIPGAKTYSKNNQPNVALITLSVLTFFILAAASGYTIAGKFLSAPKADETMGNALTVLPQENAQEEKEIVEETEPEPAMPIESVETVNTRPEEVNEGNSTSIPMIEQDLDASILVSNLKVDWEVPAGYAANTSAKRYLVKLGKVIQLNLKTELLLLSKPPITNKIAVEIKYNNSTRKFEAAGITISSGEKTVDDLIIQTVNKALGMNLSMNTDSFAKLQGNPVLIIHL